MPTPSDEILDVSRSSHSTCPPEDDRSHAWRAGEMDNMRDGESVNTEMVVQQPTPPASESQRTPDLTDTLSHQEENLKQMDIDEETPSSGDIMSPVSSEDKREESEQPEQGALASAYNDGCLSRSYEFSNIRVCPRCGPFPSS
jgi:hypothetical protein